MKILSKIKDYYDFVAGHDSDPRKVYVRTEENLEFNCPIRDHITKYTRDYSGYCRRHATSFFIGSVWFCDQFYTYLEIEGQFYYNYEEIPEEIKDYVNKAMNEESGSRYGKQLNYYFRIREKSKYRKHWSVLARETMEQPKNLNRAHGSPIVFSKDSYPHFVQNGRLKDIEFHKVKSAQEAFTELYNWIPYHEPEMPSDPTDLIRYEGKGFDKKTSFRHPYK